MRYDIITGYLSEDYVWEEIASWVDAVRVMYGMRTSRLGVLGHYYCGMLDVYTDLMKQSAVFGTHIELLEMCELLWLRRFPKIRFRYALSASPMRTWFMETPMKSLPITDWIKRASARLPLNS